MKVDNQMVSGIITVVVAILFAIYGFFRLARIRGWVDYGTEILIEVVVVGFFLLFLLIGLRELAASYECST